MDGGDSSASDTSVDYEAVPAMEVGQKRLLKVNTYAELHSYVHNIVKLLEEVYEMGIFKGTLQQYSKQHQTKPNLDHDQECQ